VSLLRLFRRGPTVPPIPPPLPTGPFFHAVGRTDSPPNPGMTDRWPDLGEKPPQRPPSGALTLAVGDHVGPLRFLHERPELVFPPGWPLWLYEIADVVDLRWSDPNHRWPHSVASDATVIREIPAWRYFGPHGEGVPEILEQIWALDPDRIASLEVPPGGHEFGRVPMETLRAPEDEPGPRNASFEVGQWMESRSWVAGVGGGWHYSGCYFIYMVTDPHWLVAMGLAHNAAVALAARDRFDPATVDAAIRAWQDLVDTTESRAGRAVSLSSPLAGSQRDAPARPRRGRRGRARPRAPRRR
jgi:hypothetical protein